MASLVRYVTRSGSEKLPWWQLKEGFKTVPFRKDDAVRPIPPRIYSVMSQTWIGGNTHLYKSTNGLMSGGVLSTESIPSHATTGNIDSDTVPCPTNESKLCYNRAYDKFKSKVYTEAALGSALVERQSTVTMLINRLGQLAKGARALRKGRFREFLRAFNIRPLNKHRHTRWVRPQQFSGLWLEYWMGWAPTVGDVYNALAFLGSPVPDVPVRAGSRRNFSGVKVSSNYGATGVTEWQGYMRFGIRGDVKITNPTLFNLEGLGLANPFQTLWEVTPFSWFVDWFANVGQILGSLTDFLGLQLKNLQVTAKTAFVSSWKCSKAYRLFSDAPDVLWREVRHESFCRYLPKSLPSPFLTMQLPYGLSLTRGATLISLLVTMFTPKHR